MNYKEYPLCNQIPKYLSDIHKSWCIIQEMKDYCKKYSVNKDAIYKCEVDEIKKSHLNEIVNNPVTR